MRWFRHVRRTAVLGLVVMGASSVPLGSAVATHPPGSCVEAFPETPANGRGRTATVTGVPRGSAARHCDRTGELVERQSESQTGSSWLDCSPENTVRPTGSTLTITCTARTAAQEPAPNVPIDFEVTGLGDPDAGSSPSTPDRTCTTGADGSCAITHGPITQPRTDGSSVTSYRAWIDQDEGTVVEADLAEGRDETGFPGDRPEPDDTDVVENTMRFPETVDAELETTWTSVAVAQTVSVTVYDDAGNPFVAPVTVKLELFAGSASRPADGNTPATPDLTCVTTIQGSCSVSWKTKSTGVDLVCVWVTGTPTMAGTNANGSCGNQGEGLFDPDDAPNELDPPTSTEDRVDVVRRTRS